MNRHGQHDNQDIEVSPTSYARCKRCKERIMKGTLRFKRQVVYNNIWIESFYHIDCNHDIDSKNIFTETSPNSRAKCNRCKVKIMKGQKRNYTCYIFNGHHRRKFFHDYCTTLTGRASSSGARAVRPLPRTPCTQRTPRTPRTQGDGAASAHQRCSAATRSEYHNGIHGVDRANSHTNGKEEVSSIVDFQSINDANGGFDARDVLDLQSINTIDAGGDKEKVFSIIDLHSQINNEEVSSIIDLQSINNEDVSSIIDLQLINSVYEGFDAGAGNARASSHDSENDEVIIIDL